MENVFELVGTLDTSMQECWRHTEEDDDSWDGKESEGYYLTWLICRQEKLPILISEYQVKNLLGKHVRVVCYIKSFYSNKFKDSRVSALFAHFIEECEDWNPKDENRRVVVRGCAAEDVAMDLNENSVPRLNFKLQCAMQFEDKFTTTVTCRAFDSNARKLTPLKAGDVITVKGYLTSNSTRLRVVAEKVRVERRTTDA